MLDSDEIIATYIFHLGMIRLRVEDRWSTAVVVLFHVSNWRTELINDELRRDASWDWIRRSGLGVCVD